MAYLAGEAIAHMIVSFGFDDGAWLAFSVETRKERGEAFSAIAGFFKQYELTIIAADVGTDCLLTGFDFPMMPPETIAPALTGLRELEEADAIKIKSGNALRLFPRFV